jgi:hypothetical protein
MRRQAACRAFEGAVSGHRAGIADRVLDRRLFGGAAVVEAHVSGPAVSAANDERQDRPRPAL